MNNFIILPREEWYVNPNTNKRQLGIFLNNLSVGFYHAYYSSGGLWRIEKTIENMIWTLKNDATPFPSRLPFAKRQLTSILQNDLPKILKACKIENLTVCVVPRSKEETYYRPDQLYFRQAVSDALNGLQGFSDGTKHIIRHTNTRTTHLNKNGEGGEGPLPYPGITKNTCTISNSVVGKNILLIDDLYTPSVNIDEDAIQALLNKGARSVIFYAVGYTRPKSIHPCFNDELAKLGF